MFQQYTYAIFFGLPVIAYLGMATLTAFLVTASVGFLNLHGIRIIPFVWHPRLAAFAIALAITHGTFGILAYF